MIDVTNCAHKRTDNVETRDLDETRLVALVCVDCLAALPVNWGCTDCEWVETRILRGDRYIETGHTCSLHRKVSA